MSNPLVGSSATNANGSEKKTTKTAWSWKSQKKFRFARAPPTSPAETVPPVLLLSEHAVEEEVRAEAKAPNGGEQGREHACW